MKATKLIALLTEEVLKKGDGEVVFVDIDLPENSEQHSIYTMEVHEDEDAEGNVTKRKFVLFNS